VPVRASQRPISAETLLPVAIAGAPSARLMFSYPFPLRRPPSGFTDQIAAIRADDQIRGGQRVEAPTNTSSRAPIVEDHHAGDHTPAAEHDASRAARIDHHLLETRAR
jgi:hypothetical protein